MLVIKGAYYYDKLCDTIVVPHYTSDSFIVDSDKYIPMKELKKVYNIGYIKENANFRIKFRGHYYYYAEYAPFYINEWDLLSDLSKLSYKEKDFDFD